MTTKQNHSTQSSTSSTYEYLISACLVGQACRYNGVSKTSNACQTLYDCGQAIMVCPEVMVGLTTPRQPAEPVEGVIRTKDGTDVTQQFLSGAQQCLSIAQMFGIKKAILKEASPSCGVHLIYDGTFTGVKVPGRGVTAQLLSEHGINVISDEELK